MAIKLVDQEEAAKILGVSVEEINAMRDRKDLFPFRDGNAWKYKVDDLERLKNDLAGGGSLGAWNSPADLADIPLEVNEHVESILLSEKELGESSESTSSTIIGIPGRKASPGDSDLKLAAKLQEEPPAAPGSDANLAAGLSGTGSDVKLMLGGSEAGKKLDFSSSSDLDLRLEPSGSSTKVAGVSGSGSELKLGDPSGSSSKKQGKPGSGTKKLAGEAQRQPNFGDSDDLTLEADADVLGQKPGSDITRGATDSGIHLIDPKDSGLSLELPLELSGSNVELLELGEADASGSGATKLKSDDDFLLTPIQEDAAADESDSGSQVIALDSEEDLSSGAFAPASSGMVAMLEEEGGEGMQTPMPGLTTAGATAAGPALITAPSVPEAPYSWWNIIGLICCTVLLLLTGVVMQDMMRNMWKWDGPEPITRQITDSFGSTFHWMDNR